MAKRILKKAEKTDMPGLVAVMTKFVERLESLEKKSDFLTSRLSSLPAEFRQILAELPRSVQASSQPRPVDLQPNHGVREKILYDAVCADCVKPCRVPFRPSENRPVYCPACFAIRKAGHVPQDPTQRAPMMHPPKQIVPAAHKVEAPVSAKRATPSKKKKQKPTKKSKK